MRRREILAALLAPALLPRAAAAQAGAPRMRPLTTALFRIDAPEKDWRLLPGGVNTLGALVHKDDAATIIIEREVLQIALAATEVDANFAELEMTTIREREVTGTSFTSRLDQSGRRRAVVDYQRRGREGAEQVRVYVLVQGKQLYRLVCVAPAAQFARFLPVFQASCTSFMPLEAA